MARAAEVLGQNRAEYERLIEVFAAHNVAISSITAAVTPRTRHIRCQLSTAMGFPVTCIGVPKTVDNDLPLTDCCPGFGSVAKYVAVATREAGLDVASMAETSTKVFILEVMGRHAGWIAAAAGLRPRTKIRIIVFPERAFGKSFSGEG